MTSPRTRHTSSSLANEGHVAEILLLTAVEIVMEQADRPLSVPSIVDILLQEGHPPCPRHMLFRSVRTLLEQKPAMFAKEGPGWRLAKNPLPPRWDENEELAPAVALAMLEPPMLAAAGV